MATNGSSEILDRLQPLSLIQCATPDDASNVFSLLTPLPSLLAFGRSGLFGPPLCGGSAPATPPLLKPPAASSVWQYDLDDPLRPGFLPRLGRFRECASAGKPREATPIHTQRSSCRQQCRSSPEYARSAPLIEHRKPDPRDSTVVHQIYLAPALVVMGIGILG